MEATIVRSRRHGEAGSAYIITLMSIVVLSILGLGLALITQTEMQVSAGEITTQRIFYAADSGVSTAVARVAFKFDCAPFGGINLVDEDVGSAGLNLRQALEVPARPPLLDSPIDLSQINDCDGSVEENSTCLYNEQHPTTSRATRYRGNDPTPVADRVVSAFVSLQPWQPNQDCANWLLSPEVSKIKM